MVEYIPHAGLIGVIVWALRLEGRVNTHESVMAERDQRYTDRDNDIKARLVRIEDKLDRQNGRHRRPSGD